MTAPDCDTLKHILVLLDCGHPCPQTAADQTAITFETIYYLNENV